MAMLRAPHQRRCFILDIPPELRLQIYDHVEPWAMYWLEHTLVLDKHGQARVIRKSKASPLLQTCSIIRNECLPLITPWISWYYLTIDSKLLQVEKGDGGRQDHARYDQLVQFGDNARLNKVRIVTLSVLSPGKTGAATARKVLTAVNAAIQFLNSMTDLGHLELLRRTVLRDGKSIGVMVRGVIVR